MICQRNVTTFQQHHCHCLIGTITSVINIIIFFFAVEGEKFQNTSWVNHFKTQSVEIGNLSPDLYEFKTVARNDFPDQESPASEVTEARPLPGVVSKSFSSVTLRTTVSQWCHAIKLKMKVTQ